MVYNQKKIHNNGMSINTETIKRSYQGYVCKKKRQDIVRGYNPGHNASDDLPTEADFLPPTFLPRESIKFYIQYQMTELSKRQKQRLSKLQKSDSIQSTPLLLQFNEIMDDIDKVCDTNMLNQLENRVLSYTNDISTVPSDNITHSTLLNDEISNDADSTKGNKALHSQETGSYQDDSILHTGTTDVQNQHMTTEIRLSFSKYCYLLYR